MPSDDKDKAMARPRYAVNHYLCPPQVRLDLFAQEVAEAGFDGIGLTEAALAGASVPSLRSVLNGCGLQVSSVNTAGFFLSADAGQARRNDRLLDIASELDAGVLNIIIGAADETVPLDIARSQAQDALAAFAQKAADCGVQLVLEPLWIANAFTKSCVHSISQTERIFSHIPGLKLNLDYYHLWADPDLARALRGQGCDVGLLQICDVDWRGAPNLAVRAPLGQGRLSVLAQLESLGWQPGQCTLELELFIDQLPSQDYAALIRAAARQLKLK